jgi:hypothetical protein
LWRGDVGHSAQWPEHDLVCDSTDLAAGQRMSKLVHQDDPK